MGRLTSEDIKRMYTMRDVLGMYGLEVNRAGFMCCPFHQERTPSFKAYLDSWYCYGCHESGDIFTFVMKMDGCDFPTAFKKLGGVYEGKVSLAAVDRKRKAGSQRDKLLKELQRADQEYRQSLGELEKLNQAIKEAEPFSDEWCELINKLPVANEQVDTALIDAMDAREEYKGRG